MRLMVDINDECIKAGVKNECSGCPASLAVAATFAASGIEVGVVEVDGMDIDVWTPQNTELMYIARRPEEINLFVSAFDHDAAVAPVKVEVEFEVVAAGNGGSARCAA